MGQRIIEGTEGYKGTEYCRGGKDRRGYIVMKRGQMAVEETEGRRENRRQ